MKKIKYYVFLICGFIISLSATASCNFKNTSNYVIFETTAMSVISGSVEIDFTCNANYPYKLYPFTDSINVYDNNENLEVTYWLDPGFTEKLTRSSPIFGIGTGKTENYKIYIKVTGKGPALTPKGNIVVNRHNLKLKHNLVIE